MMDASNPTTQPHGGPEPEHGGLEPSSDLSRLTAAMCDGTATHTDRDQLERLLANPLARKEYVAALRVHAELAWRWPKAPRQIVPRPRPKQVHPLHRDPENDGLTEPPAARAPRWRVIAGTTLAACVVIAALVVIQAIDQGWWRPSTNSLARVVASDGAVWQPDAAVYAINDAVAVGDVLSLASGLVEISYADGTAVVLEGPASFEVRAATDGRLTRGRLTATLGASSKGFAVHTPSAVITDLGTQFGVEVDAAGRTDVRVFEGLVELAAVASLGAAAPARLAAGNAAEVNDAGRITLVDTPAPKKFVLSLPKPAPRPPKPRDYRWNEATAVTAHADPFLGSGLLVGTAPSSRGGTSDAAWLAPDSGWQLDSARNVLRATSAGAAFLPFAPEPGWVYRISVTMHVSDGSWAAVGLTGQANTNIAGLDYAWVLQRHTTTLRLHDSTKSVPNAAYLGPGQAGAIGRGDTLTGEQTRTIVLDTTKPRWRALFFAGDELVGQGEFETAPKKITHVALSVFENTTAEFRNFSIESCRP
jgi:hypothetical protein